MSHCQTAYGSLNFMCFSFHFCLELLTKTDECKHSDWKCEYKQQYYIYYDRIELGRMHISNFCDTKEMERIET